MKKRNDAGFDRHAVLQASDMDIVGTCFAIRLTEGCSNGCVELYVEDDENYHFKACFDVLWLTDLIEVASAARSTASVGDIKMTLPATTIENLRGWLQRGKNMGASHMLIVCDTFDYEDYPKYVMPGEDVHAVAKENDGPNMTRLMEVYRLDMDWEKQLSGKARVFNY